ncbi:MAG: PAS domain-containing protein, partial [Rhodospirillaceae bacterium]
MTSSDYGLPDQPSAMETLCAGLCNHANDAVVLTDSDRRILWCNRAFEELTGYTLAELAGREKDTLYDVAGESALSGPRYGGQSGNGLFPMRLRRKDGATIAIEMANWPWAGSSGRLAGHFAICRDTTEEDRQRLAHDSLVAILTDQRLDERTKIEAILTLACDYFKMPVALVCALEGQMMSVVHAKSSLTTVSPGTRFDLSQSMCSTTLAVDG